jgi:hypothetical protein
MREPGRYLFRYLDRREALKQMGLAAGALALSPFLLRRAYAAEPTKVFVARNGDCFENTAAIWEMLGGPESYIGPSDVVVIKGNGQWPNQGYTHTGVIKGVIDGILAIPGFSGEVLICDNVQNYGSAGAFGFDATPENRTHNWPDHNWNSLAAEYQAVGKPVSAKRWYNSSRNMPATNMTETADPATGEGWVRSTFDFHGGKSYLSYPVFQSPLNTGRMIDLKNGVWENGAYTGRKVKVIVMPGLNNHGNGSGDYAGITSAIKAFFGMTEIHTGAGSSFQGYRNIHTSSYSLSSSYGATYAGELASRYIQTMVAPVLYITAAIWSGHYSRTGGAVQTNTVLACENPATLDYVACRDVISPYADYLDPDLDNNTRRQILACIGGGVGTIVPDEFQVVSCDFSSRPAAPTGLAVQ